MSRGLVHRTTDAQDRRRSILSLTDRGRAIYERIVPMAREREARILSALSKAEADALMASLVRLQASATTFDDGGPDID